MQSENFDKRIREAADHHHPNYDEKAWAKMETLLDKHMPVKEKKRRRFLLFFLLFLFAGSASWLMVNQPWHSNTGLSENESATSKSANPHSPHPRENSTYPGNSTTEDLLPGNSNGSSGTPQIQPVTPAQEPTGKANEQHPATVVTGHENEAEFRTKVGSGTIGKRKQVVQKNNIPDNQLAVNLTSPKKKTVNVNAPLRESGVTTGEPASKDQAAIISQESLPHKTGEKPGEDKLIQDKKTNEDVVDTKLEDPLNNSEDVAGKKDAPKQIDKKNRKSSFFVNASIAPDLSMVGRQRGQVKLLSGVGVGYTYKEKLTLRTGFYAGRKIYTAQPGDYKPVSPVPNADYLYRIEADCKVYEVPVYLSYNFISNKKANVFAGSGLSTYIMKSESYDYIYKYPGSDDEHRYNWSIDDKNKHFFSVLTLSAGYERILGKGLSVTAEPYFKLPLAGVGNGKVKLNSAGVMLSINYKPFGK